MRLDRDLTVGLVVVLLLASLPLWALKSGYTIGVAINALTFVALAQAWNIISGIGGQLSLGHAAFYGLGGYTSGLLLVHLGVTPWIGMLVGAVVATVAGVAFSYPAFRLHGIYFTLVTFVSALILEIVARHFSDFTGGDIGVNLPLLGNAPALYQFDRPQPYFYVILILAAVYFLITRWVLRSRFGYYLQALRDDQVAAEVLGVNSLRMKLLGFALSAFLTGLVGPFYTQYLLFIDPLSAFGTYISVKIVVVAVAGGVGTLWGPVIGGLLLIPFAEWANAQFSRSIIGVDVALYGLVLILLSIFLPKGVVTLPARLRASSASIAGRLGWAGGTAPSGKNPADDSNSPETDAEKEIM